ncbi:unnamed protein product [Bemisia tabaci]|uniref:Uncharacterized protein n=1 Tax=Bemisia tabaci TaxID=7038 RepID=A0A9P0A6E7_BEMTA|nr:unnamed protein product [Bemisia tabaci]
MTAVTLSWLAVLILVILSLSNLAEAKSKQRDNDDEDWGDGGFLKNQKPYTVEIEDLTLDGGSSPVIGDDVPDDQMVDSHMSNLYSEMMSTVNQDGLKQHGGGHAGGLGGHGGGHGGGLGGHGGHGLKKKKKKPKPHKKKKGFKEKFLPLLLIPFIIQTTLIPMFIMKLKMIAMKAAVLGKLALTLLAFNFIRNYRFGGAQTADEHYSNRLAEEHYGYSGGAPEIGAWVNGRSFHALH